MKKVAILLADMFDERELIYPYYRLLEAGYEVHLLAAEAEASYQSKSGLQETSTHAAKDVQAEDYAAVVIPGGFSPDYMRRSGAMVGFVRRMDELKRLIAAICHGPWMLASAVDLTGKKVTSYFSIMDDMINAGGVYLDEPVVLDGHLITSRTPRDLPFFLQALLSLLDTTKEE